MLRFVLSHVAMWPNFELGITRWKRAGVYVILLLCYLCIFFNIRYIVAHDLDFIDTGFSYLTLFLTVLNLAKTHTLPLNPKYTVLVKKFITDFNLFYHRDESEYARKVQKTVHFLSHYLAVYYITMTTFGPILFNLSPMYDNLARGMYSRNKPVNGTYASSMLYEFGFDTTTKTNGYIFSVFYNWYVTYLCSNSIIYTDLLVSLMVFQAWGHFKILLYRLDTMPRPASEKRVDVTQGIPKMHYFDDEENQNIRNLLKNIINHHRFIIDFINEISEIFGMSMLAFYAFHQISGCLLLLEVSQMTSEAFLRFGLLTFAEFQLLIQVSFVFEMISTVSGKLKDAVYSVPWECMDARSKKTVFILGMNVQEPVFLKALGLTQVGVTTMATILKTSFSYFIFLRSMD